MGEVQKWEKILLTGALGFVGKAIAQCLEQKLKQMLTPIFQNEDFA